MWTILLLGVITYLLLCIALSKKTLWPQLHNESVHFYSPISPSRRPPPCLPSTPTHMQASTWHRQRQICPAGWTGPIVLLLYCCRCIILAEGRAIIVILIIISIFFSSFNNADPSHIMLVDRWLLCCQECGPIMAVWQRQPPWLIYSIAFYPILPSYFI